MQYQPRVWTHYHIQRLYHLSSLAVFVFICLTIIYGLLMVLSESEADSSGQVSITAIVPAISPGSTTIVAPAGGGFAYAPLAPKPANPVSPQPKVTVDVPGDAVFKSVKLSNGQIASLPLFTTQNPTFQGSTDIPNAIIFLEVHSFRIIRATTYADAAGRWSWAAQESISPGVHNLWMIVQDPQDAAIIAEVQFDFYIDQLALTKPRASLSKSQNLISLPADKSGNLFDLLVSIPTQFQSVAPGDDLVANIKLINFGSAGNPVDVTIQYLVEDADGKIIVESSQTVAVATQLSILKTFHTNPAIKAGIYKLTVRVPSKDVVAVSSVNFEIQGAPVIPVGSAGKVNITFLYQTLLALLFLFALVAYYEYNKVSVLTHFIRKVDENDLRLYNK